MFTRPRNIHRNENDPQAKEAIRSSNKQALLKNGIQFYDDIASVSTFLQSKNEDFLPGFMEKIINKSKKFETKNEDFVAATLISKVIKKPETFMKVQEELLQWIESMLEWGYSLLEDDPRDVSYEKKTHHHLNTENFQHVWSVAMVALIRLISCRENHFEIGPKSSCVFQVRRCMALISNLFLLDDDNTFKPLIDHTENEEGLSIHPITSETFTKALPMMQIFGLKLACAMILTYREALLPYAGILRDLSEQLLKTYHIQLANESIDVSTFQRYRESLRFVEVFIEVFGNSCFETITKTVLPILSKNLAPFQKALLLWNSNYLEDKKRLLESNASKNKKRKKKDEEELQAVLKESPLQTACPEASVLLRSSYVTISAITSIFFNCKQQVNRHNQEEVFGSLADITTRTIHILSLWIEQVNLSANVLHLHIEALIRTFPVVAELYRLLQNIIFCISASDASSPFLNQSLYLFRCGANQTVSSEIRACCHGAIVALDAFIHPRSKPLFIPHAESIETLYESLKESVKRAHVGEIIEKFDYEPVKSINQEKVIGEFESKPKSSLKEGSKLEFKSDTVSRERSDSPRKRKDLPDLHESHSKRRRIEENDSIHMEETSGTVASSALTQEIEEKSGTGKQKNSATHNDENYNYHVDVNDDESIDVDMESASEDDISDIEF